MAPLPVAGRLLVTLLSMIATAAAGPTVALTSRVSTSTPAADTASLPVFEAIEVQEQPLFEPIVSGAWTRDRTFLRQLQEPLCRPRSVLVPVTPLDATSGAKFSPDRVLVARCAGSCGASSKACVPTATSTARVPAVLLSPGGNSTAGHVLVQRHDACACSCATQPEHCTDRQEYARAECRCRCRAQLAAEVTNCNARAHFLWDDRRCRCGCQREEDSCRPGRVWVPELCQCRPFLPPDSEITEDMTMEFM